MPDDFITVTISDQDFKIKCSELEVELLNRSAAYLDIKMSELKIKTIEEFQNEGTSPEILFSRIPNCNEISVCAELSHESWAFSA